MIETVRDPELSVTFFKNSHNTVTHYFIFCNAEVDKFTFGQLDWMEESFQVVTLYPIER